MSSAYHIIRHYAFDVQFDTRARAYSLQNRISELFRQRLATDTEQLLERMVPENMIAVLDRLELDLGRIQLKDLEQELPVRLMDALEKALTGVLNSSVSGQQYQLSGPVNVKHGDDRLLDWLHHYLLTGSLPWWATAAERAEPEQPLLQLAAAAPDRLAAFLRRIAQAEYVRKRIAWQFSVKALQQIVQVLEPAEAAFIFAYSKEVLQVQQQRQIVQTEGTTLERAVWLFVLTYLVTESSSQFNRKQFVRSQLSQLARHFNISYEQLLQLFYDALNFYAQQVKESSVGAFIRTLYEESAGLPASGATRRYQRRSTDQQGITAAETTEEQIAILRYYLEHGSFPWWAPPVSLTVLYMQVRALAREAASPLQRLLTTVLRQQTAWKRWVEIISASLSLSSAGLDAAPDALLLPFFDTAGGQPEGVALLTGASSEQQQLRDILLYRLIYGSVPWWGSGYAHFSLNSLLLQLIEQWPEQAVAVFKYAGTAPAAMERFITGIEAPVFFRIAHMAGLPPAAQEVYESVYALLQHISASIAPGTGTGLQLPLKKALWQTWAGSGYMSLTLAAFIDAAILLWSEDIHIIPGSLLLLMKHSLPAVKSTSGHDWLADHLQKLMNSRETEWEAVSHIMSREWEPAAAAGYHPLLLLVRKGIVPTNVTEMAATGRTVMEWLRAYLRTGHLPAEAGVLSAQETSWLAVKMLEWLYVNNREVLPGVAAAVEAVPVTLNRLFELWQLTGATPAPIRELLAGWMEQAITPPASGTMIVRDGLWEEVAATAPVVLPATQRSSLPAAASRLLHRLRQYETLTPFSEQQHWLEQAVQLVSYYLDRQELPDHLGVVSTAVMHELLKQAVWVLYREKPAVLSHLFSSSNGPVSARMQVYNLFATPAGIQEIQLRQSLEKYALQDSLLLLQETAGASIHRPIAGFREAIQYYQQQSRQERSSFYKKVFQHTVLVQHAAQQLDDATFLEMMQDIDIGWGHPATSALKELQQLLDLVITDSQEREQVRVLFRQFHILLLAGHFTLHNAREYAQRFLAFMAANGHTGIQRLTGRLAEMKQEAAASSYLHLRNILPALQEQAAQYAQAHTRQEEVRDALYEKDVESLLTSGQLHPAPDQTATETNPVQSAEQAATTRNINEAGLLPVRRRRPGEEDPLALPERQDWKEIKKPAPETIYVANAGLVVLHPFLATGFQHLGYTQGGQFTSQDAKYRAVHFLQYTVTGQENPPEHELVLNKVLCSIPLEEPVPLDIVLTDAEKQLATGLLNAVIQQWDKMKNTSIEGFRGSFLIRDGALHETEEAWHLRVETRGYDVIMQTMPWGLGMIKAAWMEKMLLTEWIYA
ncbi:hypothetical protein F0L74_27850 [Chitinophaga agrisoli]|uniref:Uncharacterized protein n=1 Tax=Chitinophaga agrisoli TaxID=2607653 RepID=A0A5B2VNM6_9BACT|nr:contractile injection system tape measure protein [Chitinophaga agrisoli]KAA2239996.1 hypothetical protein F0L74_27850 [Chitinophaga agrisoli]